MDAFYQYFFFAVWIAWMIYWMVSARNVKPTVRRESVFQRLLYTGLLIAGIVLLSVVPNGDDFLRDRIWPQSLETFWAGAALTLAGVAFTVWARVALGRNWSGTVTLKENHELIQSGPYGLARHPIYTGLMMMFMGSAIAMGEWRGVLAVAVVLISFLIKLRLEEQWMTELFGEKYVDYRKRVAMLIPYVW